MRASERSWVMAGLPCLLLLVLGAGCSGGDGNSVGGAPDSNVVELPLSFTVVNRNTASPACTTDGLEYQITAQLVAPAEALVGDAPAVTLYTHGLLFGISGWRFSGIDGYDFPLEMARLGHASIVYDKLGYGSSGLPDGLMTCVGADADVAGQIVAKLRSGDYLAGGEAGPRFARVALGGISGGGGAAEIAAFTFRSVDALVVMGWADTGTSQTGAQLGAQAGETCLQGGEAKHEGGPQRYTYFARETPEVFFHDYDPQVLEYVKQHQERDPCGAIAQLATIGPNNRPNVSSIDIPVLVILGERDALYAPGTANQQAALYTGSSDVTAIELPETGHALRGERSVPLLRAQLSAWLASRGF